MPICVECGPGNPVEELFCCEKCGAPEGFEFPVLTYCAEHQERHTMGYHKAYATPLGIYTEVLNILSTEEDDARRRDLFVEDLFARWVGVEIPPRMELEHGDSPVPSIWCTPRMPTLLCQASKESCDNSSSLQYPSLVSFVGGTGTGKSTLIKSLIRLDGKSFATTEPATEPIPSSQATSAALNSTSSDIHLYLDPLTAHDDQPMLLADSEGLDGGEPIALRALDTDDMIHEDGERITTIPPAFKLGTMGWATGNKRDRSYLVEHLFPRFLYTFSDVVCFVTAESREITKEAVTLLKWASTGYERTLNQRTPPALIIVMNQPRHVPDNSEWKDPDAAVQFWLNQLDQNQDVYEFVRLREELSQKGIDVVRPSEMLKRYYSSIKLVWIPHNTAQGKRLHRPHAEIYCQLQVLHKSIRSAAQITHTSKADANLRLSTTMFEVYTKKALRHFAMNEFAAFDLEAAAGMVRPGPVLFQEHVISVLLLLKKASWSSADERDMFRRVALLIAAAVGFLSYQCNETDKIKHYHDWKIANQCEILYNIFLETHWRCEDVVYERRCTNIKKGHSKGHQYEVRPEEVYGIRFRDGGFEANNAHMQCYENFTSHIVAKIKTLPKDYTPTAHVQNLLELQSWLSVIKTQRTCLSCLWRNPQHILPCQHVLCHDCAARFDTNKSKDPSQLWISACPFGCSTISGWPWKGIIKPRSAGARVLSLDGGGVRGLFEIMILEEIQGIVHGLGLRIPVIELFDLVVGTSAGGIIALGLAHGGWSIEQCKKEFTDLAKKAFELRPGMALPGIRGVLKYAYSYIYRTEVIENVYRRMFGDKVLFGGPTPGSVKAPSSVKVAVTTVERRRDGFRTYLLTNYSRPFPSGGRKYRLLRAGSPEKELKTWEAARATTAAPTFFKPFTHPFTSQTLEDGALSEDNPTSVTDQELYAIWGNQCPLDLHLSLGSGFLSEAIELPRRHSTTGIGLLANIAKEFVQDGMNAQKQYEQFIFALRPPILAGKYWRLNVEIGDGKGKTPIDKVNTEEIQRLAELATKYCQREKSRDEMERISKVLVASCFFFDNERWEAITEREDSVWVCRGVLATRLPVCRWNETQQYLDRGLNFIVRNRDGPREKEFEIRNSHDSLVEGCFRMDISFEVVKKEMKYREIVIALLIEDREGRLEEWPISGFPRVIVEMPKD